MFDFKRLTFLCLLAGPLACANAGDGATTVEAARTGDQRTADCEVLRRASANSTLPRLSDSTFVRRCKALPQDVLDCLINDRAMANQSGCVAVKRASPEILNLYER